MSNDASFVGCLPLLSFLMMILFINHLILESTSIDNACN